MSLPRPLDYVVLPVESVERTSRFYGDVLGLPVTLSDDRYVELGTGGPTRLALLERGRFAELTSAPAGARGGHVAWIVDDVDAEARRLRQRGIAILAEPRDQPWGQRNFYFLDPDGNVIEYCQPMPRSDTP